MKLRLEDIRMDGGTQPRSVLNFDTIDDYADAMAAGAKFPPVTVYYDGEIYWLGDGFHRVRSCEQNGGVEIDADIIQGTLEDAKWHSFGANQKHGLRRTNEDKQRAVQAALAHPKSSDLSDRQIAKHVGVSHETVRNYRDSICQSLTDSKPAELRTVTRKGTTYQQNTGNIGRRVVMNSPSPSILSSVPSTMAPIDTESWIRREVEMVEFLERLSSRSDLQPAELSLLERAHGIISAIFARSKESSAA